MMLWAKRLTDNGHNPYFNRWFSAIIAVYDTDTLGTKSQSLF